MSSLAGDPIEVLDSVRRAASTSPAEEQDFTSPSGSEPRHVAVPGPGVAHPAHHAWIAECLEETLEWVDRTLVEGTPEDSCGVRVIARALRDSRGAGRDRLRSMGIDPEELVLRLVPVPPGNARPNPHRPRIESNPVLSPENASLLMFWHRTKLLARRIKLGVPAFIIDNDVNQLQRSFRELNHVLQGLGPVFEPYPEGPTNPPSPASLIIAPRTGGWVGAPLRPLQVAVAGSTAVVRFPGGIARIDVRSGEFSTHPLADAGLLALVEGRALFRDGVHLVVFDTNDNAFAMSAPSVPRRVVVGACCGVAVLDTETRMVATMPGPLASSAFDVVTSACGRYGWLELSPQLDDVGVFSIERLESVFQPWPHAKLGRPELLDDPGEGHDDAARALACLPDGSFRCLYGEHVLHEATAHRLPITPLAAAFDANGEQLVTTDSSELRRYVLNAEGRPALESAWSLGALRAHFSACDLDLEASGVEEARLMGAAGTVGALAALTAQELAARLFLDADSSHAALEAVIAAARSTFRRSSLERIAVPPPRASGN